MVNRILLLVVWTVLLVFASHAHARNVPGSAGAVLGEVDSVISSSLVDISLANANAALLSECMQRRENGDGQNVNSCEWGFSINGQVLNLDSSPSGFSYESTNALGSLTVARWLTGDTAILGGVLFESGQTDTHYNSGKVDQSGFGFTAGIIHHVSLDHQLMLLGGAEWLSYDINRSNGAFSGEFEALRLFADASVMGRFDGENAWVTYRGSLRAMNQDNEAYWETSGGVPTTFIDDVDQFILSTVADLKFGTAFENISPYIQFTGSLDLYEDRSTVPPVLAIDESDFNGRVGLGFDAGMLAGLMSISGGAHFNNDGYSGFDLRAGYSKNF